MESREFVKKTNKFNIVDIFLIVIIIAAMSVLIYVLMGNDLIASSQNTTILYKITVEIARNDFLPSVRKLQKGDEVLDSVRNQVIGSIYEVEIEDAYMNVPNLYTGVVERILHPGHSKITLTVKVKCQKDINYYIGGRSIIVGTRIDFKTPYFTYSGWCTYLEETDADS
jgi:hypothetical protein